MPATTPSIVSMAERAAPVEMDQSYGAAEVAKATGAMSGGKGKAAIVNAPPTCPRRRLLRTKRRQYRRLPSRIPFLVESRVRK
jgi:hypothetical protein